MMKKLGLLTTFLAAIAGAPVHVVAQEKPNIVLIFMDNFGWGEPGFNGGGIIRGAETPRLDSLASAGLRLTNFNVEVQCTASRSALMTGRYAIRSGNGSLAEGENSGLVQVGSNNGRNAVRYRVRDCHVRQVAPWACQWTVPYRSGL